jgi:hypothetical protein
MFAVGYRLLAIGQQRLRRRLQDHQVFNRWSMVDGRFLLDDFVLKA